MCFFFSWLRRVFVTARGLSLVAASGGYSLLRCEGFSLQWLLLLWSTGSRHTGFSSCSTWAQQLRLAGSRVQAQQFVAHGHMWNLPRPGIEPMSPAFTGRFLTTVPQGKSLHAFLFKSNETFFPRSFCNRPLLWSSWPEPSIRPYLN